MCGLAAGFNLAGSVCVDDIKSMMKIASHRGPDGINILHLENENFVKSCGP